jgi:putative membrane protein
MKNSTPFKAILFQTVLITATLFSVLSCKDNTKADDGKKVAEKTNEATITNRNKEKDAEFLVEAAVINTEEIKLGQLAQKKSTTKDVKDLGKMMEDGHTKALNDLIALAAKKAITIPTLPINKVEQAYQDLSAKSKIDFDKSYSSKMVDGHKDAIALFEKAAAECNDPDIKQWASTMLPDLRAHLDMAMTTQSKVDKMK